MCIVLSPRVPVPGPRDAVVRHLLAWFKHEHFKWVNNAPCDACGSKKTKNAGNSRNSSSNARMPQQ
eukprot:1028109-Rhodomonas_salina.4